VPWRQRLHDLVESEYFADGLSFVIVLNTMLLGVQHELDSPIGSLWTQNDAMLQYLQFRAGSEGANLAFLLIYTLELVLKVTLHSAFWGWALDAGRWGLGSGFSSCQGLANFRI
jgi:hypothetical protein